MAGEVAAGEPADDYEIFDDSNHLKTVVAASNETNSWIDPSSVKLRHRIGRGPFGDTWLATHHCSTEDSDEYQEVAVKMLHLVKEVRMRVLLEKLNDLFLKTQGVEGVCWMRGISVMHQKICIIMKFYEGSVGDRMTQLKGGKISRSKVFRYAVDLARGILELHSKGILVLNLKPFNFLLNESDQAVVGDIGIPYQLLGILLQSSDLALMLGTPYYMAPEQWQPDVRGPISFETDSWGFACSIIEMLTGVQPWCGKSDDEIYDAVVWKQEKPPIPSGLPPAVENVLLGCFEYDFRNRPLMTDILHVFESDGGSIGLGSRIWPGKSNSSYTERSLLKDVLKFDDMVRSRKPPNSCNPKNMDVPEGKVVGLERNTEGDSFVLVRVHGIHDPLRVRASSLERVTFGFAAGDWVRIKEEDRRHSPVGILHSIQRDGGVSVGFLGLETLWKGQFSELQMAESYCVGQFVRLKANVLSPRFDWPRKSEAVWATGRICLILPNGCLIVKFPGRLTFREKCSSFLADPAEVEVVNFNTCPGMISKYQHLEDLHWAATPLLVALSLFTAMKLGVFAGRKLRASKMEIQQNSIVQKDGQHGNGQATGNPTWLPPSVANILSKGTSNAAAR